MLVTSKSILAKLLAKENIRVEHRKVNTAMFDLKSRTLVCPIWGDMSSELYDLLMAHEVGHALNTPAQGWHDAVTAKGKGFRSYLNVVEDARIERKIKEMYPGLRSSFHKAYEELNEREFFGDPDLLESDLLPLIDRINIHFKLGAFANMKFTSEEQKFVEKVSKVQTWDDVDRVASELYEYGKAEMSKLKELLDELNEEFEFDANYDDEGEDYSDSDFERMEADSETLEKLRKFLSSPDVNPSNEPLSITDSNFRNKELDLLDAKAKPYYYVNTPSVKLENCVVSYKYVKDSFEFKAVIPDNNYGIVKSESEAIRVRDIKYKKFLETNKKYISYLIKEFELRRNAQQFARAKVSKSGEIDLKKVYSYQFNEDIFKRMTTIPGGKNHGLVMVIDFSGSMTNSILGTIEQTLLLAIFCRKLNIPFKVLSFTDRIGRLPSEGLLSHIKSDSKSILYEQSFSSEKNEINIPCWTAKLVEYISSELTGTEFTEACKNFLFLGHAMSKENSYKRYNSQPDDPSIEYNFLHSLGGTPLNEAILIATELVTKFRADYKLDIVNTIFLSDGQGHEFYAKNTGEYSKHDTLVIPRTTEIGYNSESANVIITHKGTKIQGHKIPGTPMTCGLLDMMKNVTGSNVIGFYLMDRTTPSCIYSYGRNYGKYFTDAETRDANRSIRTNKFAGIDIPGYDKFFLMPNGKDLEIEEEEIEAENNASKNDIKRAFLKLQKNKATNRVFLSKFVEQIA